jgi:hypothetical protein
VGRICRGHLRTIAGIGLSLGLTRPVRYLAISGFAIAGVGIVIAGAAVANSTTQPIQQPRRGDHSHSQFKQFLAPDDPVASRHHPRPANLYGGPHDLHVGKPVLRVKSRHRQLRTRRPGPVSTGLYTKR